MFTTTLTNPSTLTTTTPARGVVINQRVRSLATSIVEAAINGVSTRVCPNGTDVAQVEIRKIGREWFVMTNATPIPARSASFGEAVSSVAHAIHCAHSGEWQSWV